MQYVKNQVVNQKAIALMGALVGEMRRNGDDVTKMVGAPHARQFKGTRRERRRAAAAARKQLRI